MIQADQSRIETKRIINSRSALSLSLASVLVRVQRAALPEKSVAVLEVLGRVVFGSSGFGVGGSTRPQLQSTSDDSLQ